MATIPQPPFLHPSPINQCFILPGRSTSSWSLELEVPLGCGCIASRRGRQAIPGATICQLLSNEGNAALGALRMVLPSRKPDEALGGADHGVGCPPGEELSNSGRLAGSAI